MKAVHKLLKPPNNNSRFHEGLLTLNSSPNVLEDFKLFCVETFSMLCSHDIFISCLGISSLKTFHLVIHQPNCFCYKLTSPNNQLNFKSSLSYTLYHNSNRYVLCRWQVWFWLWSWSIFVWGRLIHRNENDVTTYYGSTPRILPKHSERIENFPRYALLEKRLNMCFRPHIFSFRQINLYHTNADQIIIRIIPDNAKGQIE